MNQLDQQKEAVKAMESSPCQCIVYHPKPGTDEWQRLCEDWLAHKYSAQLAAQLFGDCPNQ